MSETILDHAPSRPLYRYVALIWLLITIGAIFHAADSIARASLGDPDNYMRLVQVRDWLAGQSWTDVVQHRMNPPHGGDIHWSRLVDMPIALIIMVLRPLFGQGIAEMAALIAVPALLSLALMLVLAPLLRNLAGRGVALALLALLPLCLFVSAQFMPMRIDHHGWQILMAAIALVAWTRPGMASAALAGAALAFWMHVSIEGLPYAMLFGGLYMMTYVLKGDRRVRAYLGALTIGSLLFLVSTHGLAALARSYCDAISAPYVAALLLATGGFLIADYSVRPLRWQTRLISPLLAGSAALAGIALVDPVCLAGPFAALDPLTRDVWYLNVNEGQPVWRQSGSMSLVMILAPLTGLAVAIVHAWTAYRSRRDLTAVGIAIAALFAWGIGLLILRAGGVAQIYALPGMAILIGWLIARSDQFHPRILWSVSMAAALLLATAIPPFVLGAWLFADNDKPTTSARTGNSEDADSQSQQCVTPSTGAALRSIGKVTLLAPLDVGPVLLYQTDVSIIASGYHRNSAAIAKVIRAYTSPADAAHAIVLETPAQYLLLCSGMQEMTNYKHRAPTGLAAALDRGNIPNWLAPDARLQTASARLYRVIR